MIARFSRRQLLVFVLMLTVLGAAIIGLYFYLLYPRYQEIEELNNRVANEKKYWPLQERKLPNKSRACRKASWNCKKRYRSSR